MSSTTSSPDYDENAASLIYEIFLAIRPQYAPFRLTANTWMNAVVPAEDNSSQTVRYYYYKAEWATEWVPLDLDPKILHQFFCLDQCDDAPVILGPIINELLGYKDSPEVFSVYVLPKLWFVTEEKPLVGKNGLRRGHTLVRIGPNVLDITGGQFGATKLRLSEVEYRRENAASQYGEGTSMSLEQAASSLPTNRTKADYWNPLFTRLRRNLDTAFKAWMTDRGLTKEKVVLDPVRRQEVVELFRKTAQMTRVEFNVEYCLGGLSG
ncbi:hypothetical protein BU16DRAFT_567395 [Lophium mytilinum]|uniref:Uncharacterized protein n=1 Tax=Lophium mytilinum TaxID=390894 RepID=A0A6A6QA51_9PEZI|nr:hypothetical protein BU16DRAFT_567395 [Lophium mytilinum]